MQKSHENQLLLETVKSFMEKEIYPHEEQVDKAGVIPEELGRHIEKNLLNSVFMQQTYLKMLEVVV